MPHIRYKNKQFANCIKDKCGYPHERTKTIDICVLYDVTISDATIKLMVLTYSKGSTSLILSLYRWQRNINTSTSFTHTLCKSINEKFYWKKQCNNDIPGHMLKTEVAQNSVYTWNAENWEKIDLSLY